MRVSVTEQVTAPRDEVFRQVTDFDGLLGKYGGRHIRIERLDSPAPVTETSLWRGSLVMHGISRAGSARMVSLRAPDGYEVEGLMEGLRGRLWIDLSDEGDDLTDLKVTIDLKPTSLWGRMIVRSLQLIRTVISRRLQVRLAKVARDIETRQA